MKACFSLLFSLLSVLSFAAPASMPTPAPDYFPLSRVHLLESPFLRAQQLDLEYLLSLDADRLLAPFVHEAGLEWAAEYYPNWENTGLGGHIGGHYLSAMSMMYASTGDQRLKERIDYMVGVLARVQQANGDGYIGGVPEGKAVWKDISEGRIDARPFSLNGKWVPLYNIHKIYAGLRDAWIHAGSEQARDLLVHLTDWMLDLTANLTDAQMQDMLSSEHGGLNEVFADVAAITGDDKYLLLACRFSHQAILDPLLQGEDKLTGMHANTQIPKVIGFKRIADVAAFPPAGQPASANHSPFKTVPVGSDTPFPGPEWSDAADFFWQTVVYNRSVCIGGHGCTEHFHPADDFNPVVTAQQGPETCNTYNMLRLAEMLWLTSPQSLYADYYERALWNHILSSQHPETGGLVYFTQMRPGHYRVYSQAQECFWCCVGSGIENHARYGAFIYAQRDDELFVNLFIPSRLDWKEKNVEVIQTNSFPEDTRTVLTINPANPARFTLTVRCPAWAANGNGVRILLNGKLQPVQATPEGYLSLTRKWKKGDKVEVILPMMLHAEELPHNPAYRAYMYGPIVLAAKTDTTDLRGLFADEGRGAHIAHGRMIPIGEMPVVVREPGHELDSIDRVAAPLGFHITGLYPARYADGMQLIPFYRVHDSRYIIYWPAATPAQAQEMVARSAEAEKAALALAALTLDEVQCGRQQPESDHFIVAGESEMGFDELGAWRRGKRFGYTMKDSAGQASCVYVKYFTGQNAPSFTVLAGGKSLEPSGKPHLSPDGTAVSHFTLTGNLQGPVLIEILGESSTPKIHEVRLLSGEMEQ